MASEQITLSEIITKAVAEATRVAIQVMAATPAERPQSMAGLMIDGPTMKQPTFNLEMEDKYTELRTFRLQVNNILSMYNTTQGEKLVKNWLGRKGLQFLEMLMNEEKKTHAAH